MKSAINSLPVNGPTGPNHPISRFFLIKRAQRRTLSERLWKNTRGLCAPSFEFLPEMFRPLLFSNLFNKSLLEFGPNPSTNRVLSLFQFHMSVFSLYWPWPWMADFPAFIASKSFDLWNYHIPQMKWHNLWHILMY